MIPVGKFLTSVKGNRLKSNDLSEFFPMFCRLYTGIYIIMTIVGPSD